MFYYHGSNKKFDKFDLNFSKTGYIHLTPHFEYAKNIANQLREDGIGYIYCIRIKDQDPSTEYKEWMLNICFKSDENLEIVEVIELV